MKLYLTFESTLDQSTPNIKFLRDFINIIMKMKKDI